MTDITMLTENLGDTDMEKKTDQQIEELLQKRLERYYQQLEELGHKELAEELRSLPDQEADLIPDEMLNDPNAQEYIEQSKKKGYRTQSKAGNTAKIPEQIAVITNAQYQNALSLFQAGSAYLQPSGINVNDLEIKGGEIYIKGARHTKAQLKTTFSDKVPENIDLTFLQLCFSIILANFSATMIEDNSLNLVVNIYYPALARALGDAKGTSRKYVEAFISKVLDFQNILGIINEEIQPVLLYAGEDENRGIVRISSPYLTKVISQIYGASIRTDRNGNPKLKKNGEPLMLPSYSYLIKPSLSKERNKYAAENVRIIIALIEQAGDNIPHIRASSIVERNVQFNASLESLATSDKNKALKRAFSKTWELLRTQTDIEKVYKNIQLPNPNDPVYLPTYKNLENTVFEFPHEGKKGYR